jgi:hypothetical protein
MVALIWSPQRQLRTTPASGDHQAYASGAGPGPGNSSSNLVNVASSRVNDNAGSAERSWSAVRGPMIGAVTPS